MKRVGIQPMLQSEIQRGIDTLLADARTTNRKVWVWTRPEIPRGQFEEKCRENPDDYHVLIAGQAEGDATMTVYEPPGMYDFSIRNTAHPERLKHLEYLEHRSTWRNGSLERRRISDDSSEQR
jgi:hypothetical protein